MRENPLKTAVLGLDKTGKLLLEATKDLDYFSIIAVADSDPIVAQQTGKIWNCAAYDDYRQLITNHQLDCLFVAAPLHSCAEFLKMAIKKKSNILKLPPFARDFSEASELVKLAQTEAVSFVPGNYGRFAKSALAMKNFFSQNQAEQPFFIIAASECQKAPDQPQNKWRSDPVLAGGGAVLYDCWEIIDQIIWNFGIPQQVYCPVLSSIEGVAGNNSPDRQQRHYLTEDSAIVTMKFSDTLSANLLAGRAAAIPGKERQKWLIAQSKNTYIRFDEKGFEVTDSLGQRTHRDEFDEDYLGEMKLMLDNFGSHLLWPDKNALVSTATDNLKNMALIEAVYLSARTGMPEEPAKILKIT